MPAHVREMDLGQRVSLPQSFTILVPSPPTNSSTASSAAALQAGGSSSVLRGTPVNLTVSPPSLLSPLSSLLAPLSSSPSHFLVSSVSAMRGATSRDRGACGMVWSVRVFLQGETRGVRSEGVRR